MLELRINTYFTMSRNDLLKCTVYLKIVNLAIDYTVQSIVKMSDVSAMSLSSLSVLSLVLSLFLSLVSLSITPPTVPTSLSLVCLSLVSLQSL